MPCTCNCECHRPKEPGRFDRWINQIRGVDMTQAEADEIIAVVQSRARLAPVVAPAP